METTPSEKGLEEHFLDLLEYDKIREILRHYCASDVGRKVVERMAPLGDREKVDVCLEQTSELTKLLRQRRRLPLSGIQDLEVLIEKVVKSGSPLEPAELLSFQSTLERARDLHKIFTALDESYPRLRSLARHLRAFPEIEKAIRKTISGDGGVNPSASDKLWDLGLKIAERKQWLRSQIEKVAESRGLRPFLQNLRPTFRSGRYVLAVKANFKSRIPGILHDWSHTGCTVFVEPDALVSAGNELSDLLCEERAEVTRILWEITREILAEKDELATLSRALGWIDFTVAKARFSLDYEMEAPRINTEGIIDLRDARHPLLMKVSREQGNPPHVVPIDVRLGEDFDLLIITGPNTGGKTVAIKTVGLLALMAQSGLHIPARTGSRMPIFRRFFADIGDEQSIQQSLSTFSSHVSQIVKILAHADPNSLVLIDELGAGTDPIEGGALAMAILERLLHLQPKVLVTTHLGGLKTFAFQRKRVENASVEFDPQSLSPTYRLSIGQPGNSNALLISRRLGMPPRVIARADHLLRAEDLREKNLIDQIQEIKIRAEKNRERTLTLRREAEKLRRDLKIEIDIMKARQNVLSREMDLEMERISRKLARCLEDGLAAFRNAPKPFPEKMETFTGSLRDVIHHTSFEEKRLRFARSLKKGRKVYLISMGREGEVVRINKSRRRLTVKIDKMDVETGFDNVSWIGSTDYPSA
jgi:DNA mismatch repair protein MutS2